MGTLVELVDRARLRVRPTVRKAESVVTKWLWVLSWAAAVGRRGGRRLRRRRGVVREGFVVLRRRAFGLVGGRRKPW